MRYLWNLRTNDFVKLTDHDVIKLDCDEVTNNRGDVIYVPRMRNLHEETIEQIIQLLLDKYLIMANRFSWGADIKKYSKSLEKLPNIGGLLLHLRLQYCVDLLIIESVQICTEDMEIEKYDAIYDTLGSKSFVRKLLSNTAYKNLKKEVKKHLTETPISEIAHYYALNLMRLEDLQLRGITRIYSKAFVKENVGFILARIISDGAITTVREGVSSVTGAEEAELELYCRIANSDVSGKSYPVEIISSQKNIVDWLSGSTTTNSHQDMRESILNWLERTGVTARLMTDEENQQYREEKQMGGI